jgi:hypothetical protein
MNERTRGAGGNEISQDAQTALWILIMAVSCSKSFLTTRLISHIPGVCHFLLQGTLVIDTMPHMLDKGGDFDVCIIVQHYLMPHLTFQQVYYAPDALSPEVNPFPDTFMNGMLHCQVSWTSNLMHTADARVRRAVHAPTSMNYSSVQTYPFASSFTPGQ